MGRDARAFELSREARQLAAEKAKLEQLKQGGLRLLDRFGRPVMPGCTVMYDNPRQLSFLVTDVKAVLDPRAPVGLCAIEMACTVTLQCMVREPNAMLVAVAYPSPNEEAQGDAAAGNGRGLVITRPDDKVRDEPPSDDPAAETPVETPAETVSPAPPGDDEGQA